MTSASLQEQGDTIRFIVNSSPDSDEARRRYAALLGVELDRSVADEIFNTELTKKFPPKTQEITASINALEALLQREV